MKLGAETELNKRNKTTSKKFDDEIMSANFEAMVIFSIYANLEQSRRWIPDVGCIKLTIFNSYLLLKKHKKTVALFL